MLKTTCLLILTLLQLINSSRWQTVPQNFGFMTVTHARKGDNSEFMKYLATYATMDCPLLTQINVVWNNQQSMEEMGVFKEQDKWVRPVYFYRTPQNSMNWRYKVPPESKAQVYFSIDDDIKVDCDQLKRGFKVWQEHAIGDIGPIVSYGPRYFNYVQEKGFDYGRKPEKNFFNIALVGLAFISRHFLDLYYLEQWQLIKMREYVKTKNNCDDIGLNWVVGYFYPELVPIPVNGTLLNISPKVAQTTTATHYPYRTACIKEFTKIFGVNTLRYVPFPDKYQGKDNRDLPLMKKNIIAKVQHLESKLKNTTNKKTQLPFIEPKEPIEQASIIQQEQKHESNMKPSQTQPNYLKETSNSVTSMIIGYLVFLGLMCWLSFKCGKKIGQSDIKSHSLPESEPQTSSLKT